MIHGWEFKNGLIQPSLHRQLAILDMKKPKTIGEMRTYMGVYKTFFPAMEKLANIMSPFDVLCGGRESKEIINWDKELAENFRYSQEAAQTNIHKLALPHPDEQLFIVPDSCSRPPASGFILFVSRINSEQKPIALPVMFVSWKLSDLHWKWSPCEIEGLGASMAVDKCSFFILRSSKPTLVFPDNKQVIQAFNKLKQGRYSTSQRLATFTNNIQRYPVEMQHGSGKLLQNLGADYIGRTTKDCNSPGCSMCKFASERSDTLLSAFSNMLGKANQSQTLDLSMLNNLTDLPVGNISAWFQLQQEDVAVSQAIKYRKSGQNPPRSSKMMETKELIEIRHYVANCTYNSNKNLLVKETAIPFEHKKKEKIVVPSWFVKPLLTQIHKDQSCPETYQLKRIFDRNFFAFQVNSTFKTIAEECYLCKAKEKIPKEMKHFSSVTDPASPCINFVSDVMKRSKQLIMVTRDSFSDFITTAIIKSETAEDLKEGLILTTSTVRKNTRITVRTDNAPGFVALKKSNDKDMAKLNLNLELSDPSNKNGVAIVDKAIQELEKEIKKISPEGNKISSSELARATMTLNSRIRNRNLSSHEILFSREQYTGDNIKLDDKDLAEDKKSKKQQNHKYSEKSKFSGSKEPRAANARKGDRVHIKSEGSKHELRDVYIVLETMADNVSIVKLLHAHDPNKATKLGQKKIINQKDIYLADPSTKIPSTIEDDLILSENENNGLEDAEKKPEEKPTWTPFKTVTTVSESDSETECSDTVGDDDTDSTSYIESEVETPSREIITSPEDTFDIQVNNDLFNNEIREEELNDVNESNDDETENNETATKEISQEDNADLLDPNGVNPPVMPEPGDNIIYYDTNVIPPVIVHAKVTPMYKTMKKKWPGWYNVLKENSTKESSVNLDAIRWKFAFDSNNDDDTSEGATNVPDEQGDTSRKSNIGNVDPHNKAISVVDNPMNMPFPEVQSLENILPLTSTPITSGVPPPARLSSVRPRGLLPLEIEESPLHQQSSSRIQLAISRRADQMKKLLSKSNSDSSS